MQFRLLYAGALFGHRDDEKLRERVLHVHDIRREFHRQLKKLWRDHPVLANSEFNKSGVAGAQPIHAFLKEGFQFIPIVNDTNGLICALDILLLRDGRPGGALADIDNRLKTIFDALRMPKSPGELGANSRRGQQKPSKDEDPFYVVVEDDKLITHLSVTTDTLLDPVPDKPVDDAVRLVINVTIRPYHVHMDNLAFT
jgi:hypothetical protein